jgi:uncharacterized protein (DUF427 family)
MAVTAPAPKSELAFVPTDRWVRAYRGGTVAAESRHPLLVWPAGDGKALYAFPEAEIDAAAFDDDALLRWDGDPDLGGFVGVPFPAADAWYEEEEKLFLGPRSPFHRIDALASSRHAAVEVDGKLVAESDRPTLLFETNHPVRVYVPRDDVPMDRLERTDHVTRCPYKGQASYYALDGRPDVAFSYETPLRESATVEGYLCFLGEGVTTTLDGEPAG